LGPGIKAPAEVDSSPGSTERISIVNHPRVVDLRLGGCRSGLISSAAQVFKELAVGELLAGGSLLHVRAFPLVVPARLRSKFWRDLRKDIGKGPGNDFLVWTHSRQWSVCFHLRNHSAGPRVGVCAHDRVHRPMRSACPAVWGSPGSRDKIRRHHASHRVRNSDCRPGVFRESRVGTRGGQGECGGEKWPQKAEHSARRLCGSTSLSNFSAR